MILDSSNNLFHIHIYTLPCFNEIVLDSIISRPHRNQTIDLLTNQRQPSRVDRHDITTTSNKPLSKQNCLCWLVKSFWFIWMSLSIISCNDTCTLCVNYNTSMCDYLELYKRLLNGTCICHNPIKHDYEMWCP